MFEGRHFDRSVILGPEQELLSMTRLGRTDWQPFTTRLQD
jgi:hypothetical protein